MLFSAFRFLSNPRTYTWRREFEKAESIDTSSLERLQALRQKAEMQEKLTALKTFITTYAKRGGEQIRAEQRKERFETVQYMTGEEEKARKIDY